jgi:hypothetical protein
MALASPASAQPSAARFSELGLPPAVSREAIESLLQRFVTRSYLKGFRHLGDERDFDHGHILYDASGRPLAILYHTQELALGRASGDDFAFIDPGARNWIQWFDDGRIENAARYLRRDYPHTPEWDWFRAAQLPALEQHRTILDKMLDPALLPVDAAKSLQLVFTRKDCEAAPPAADSKELRILLPTKEAVCLSLSAS